MMTEDQVKELLDIYDETFETESEVKDIVSGARVRVKEAKTGMKDWAERNELDPKTIKRVYKDYVEWRNGSLKWGDPDVADDYAAIQVSILDAAVEDAKGD
jgi:hypothetical protein